MDPCSMPASMGISNGLTSWSPYPATSGRETETCSYAPPAALPPIDPVALAHAQQFVLGPRAGSGGATHTQAGQSTAVARVTSGREVLAPPLSRDISNSRQCGGSCPVLEEQVCAERRHERYVEKVSDLTQDCSVANSSLDDGLRSQQGDSAPDARMDISKRENNNYLVDDTGLCSKSSLDSRVIEESSGQSKDRGDIVQRKESSCSSVSQSDSFLSLSSATSTDNESYSVLALSEHSYTSSTTMACTLPHPTHHQQHHPSSPPPNSHCPLDPQGGGQHPHPLPQGGGGGGDRRRKQRVVITDPDTVVWGDTLKCVLAWNQEGRLGINIAEKEGKEDGEIYSLVSKVNKQNAVGATRLFIGDRVLSINGVPVHEEKLSDPSKRIKAKDIIKQQSKDKPVCLIIQRPKAVRPQKQLSSSVSSSNSSSSTEVGVDLALPCACNTKNSDSTMVRLPDLRLIVLGSEAEDTAESLVGPSGWTHAENGVFSKKCHVRVRKKNSSFEWLPIQRHQRDPDANILKSIELKRRQSERHIGCDHLPPEDDSVVVEVVSVKDSRQANYCSQLVMTAHSLYIVQFDGHSFLGQPQKHMDEIQEHLDKIRTYAGIDAPIYLVSTWHHVAQYTLPMVEDIGSSLQRRFATVFARQLQYHGNCPCFMLDLSCKPSGQSQLRESTRQPFVSVNTRQGQESTVQFTREASTSSSSSSTSSSSSSPWSPLSPLSPGPEISQTFLQDHISRNFIEQGFVGSPGYPHKFLRYKEIVTAMRHQQQKCVLTSGIKQACQIEDSEELNLLLQFLHKQGTIILPGDADGMQHQSFVALHPEDLAQVVYHRLLAIPAWSEQVPAFRQHWSMLGTNAVLSPSLLHHILGAGSDAACLTVCLQHLGMIHDGRALLPSDAPQSPGLAMSSSASHHQLVPFFIRDGPPSETKGSRFHSTDRRLLASLQGYCPHGLQEKVALQLCLVARAAGGTFSIEGPNSWVFNMGGDSSIYMNAALNRCLLNFVIKSKVGFPLQNMLATIHTAMSKVKISGVKFILGPPCPLDHRCSHDMRSNSTHPHIINLADDDGARPLLCGNEDVRQHPLIKQWVNTPVTLRPLRTSVDSSGTVLSSSTRIGSFPPDVVQFVCDRMNTLDVRGRDWKGLAGKLNYTYSDVKRFESASTLHYDPCRHLLDDWGKSDDATLGNLMRALAQPPLNRRDVISELTERWRIVDD